MRARRLRLSNLGAVVLALADGLLLLWVHPFTPASYAVVALPIVAVLAVLVTSRPSAGDGSTPRAGRGVPWPGLGLLVGAVALECVALALGGRSASWPTLSSALDDLIRARVLRVIGFEVWLALGVVLVRLARRPLR